ncbi:RHS repeat-associated core domain-containing protein [Chryseobacterium hispalense]|uniref:RHS repeat-associated core domain-containing protein n=1 Tax=Chryseobacterium hispalense TaxID=1453492 RepID=UPI00391B6D73
MEENHYKDGLNSQYKFNGKEEDAETEYYYYGAGYYSLRVSLWLNVDPLADYNPFYNQEHYIDGQHNDGVYNSGNTNPYIYCYQSPVKYVDPNGKQTVAQLASGAAIGAITEYIGIVGSKMLFEHMTFTQANKDLGWDDAIDITVVARVGAVEGSIDAGIGTLTKWVTNRRKRKILEFVLKVGVDALETSLKEVLKGTSYEDMDFKSILAGSLAKVGVGQLISVKKYENKISASKKLLLMLKLQKR